MDVEKDWEARFAKDRTSSKIIRKIPAIIAGDAAMEPPGDGYDEFSFVRPGSIAASVAPFANWNVRAPASDLRWIERPNTYGLLIALGRRKKPSSKARIDPDNERGQPDDIRQ